MHAYLAGEKRENKNFAGISIMTKACSHKAERYISPAIEFLSRSIANNRRNHDSVIGLYPI